MDTPAELAFSQLLLVGIGFMLLAAGALVVFLVTYQKRLLQQQLRLHRAEAEHQQQRLVAVIEAQEAERERIGRDLHDDIGSSIAMARLLVERLGDEPPAADAAALLGLAKEVLGAVTEEVRSVSHNLYPAVLARVGLARALESLVEMCRRSSDLAVTLDLDYPRPLAPAQELALYRICQELVHNAVKHAQGATQLAIRLHQHGPRLTLVVEDDGCGIGSLPAGPDPPVSAGVGLRSIGVRVQMLQGRLHQESVPGQGTRFRIEMDGSAGGEGARKAKNPVRPTALHHPLSIVPQEPARTGT